MKKFCFLCVMTMLLLGCSTFSPFVTPTPSLIPTLETPNPLPEPTDPTQVIIVQTGQTFDIVLPANPSTGYGWRITGGLDPSFVQNTGQTFIAEQPVTPGSGGMDVWTFSALMPVEGTTEFGYFPTGDNTQPEEMVIFSVRIE